MLSLLALCAPALAAPAQTLYGFFPSPPELTAESVIATFRALGQHGELVLFARNVPWIDFMGGDAGMPRHKARCEQVRQFEHGVSTLGWFAHIGLRAADGTPKPGLEAWDSFRK